MLLIMDLLATFFFACVGATIARRTHLNFVGVTLSAFLASSGGGTVREFLLRSDSLFWLDNPSYLLVILFAISLSFLFAGRGCLSGPIRQSTESFATSVFVMVGVLAALQAGCNMFLTMLMGILTGVGGGLFRQALFARDSIVDSQIAVLTATVISLFCVVLMVLEADVILSVVCLAALHFLLSERQALKAQPRRFEKKPVRLA